MDRFALPGRLLFIEPVADPKGRGLIQQKAAALMDMAQPKDSNMMRGDSSNLS